MSVRQLVEGEVRDASFDLMRDVAGVFPVLAICEIVAIPQPDHERFRQWGSDLGSRSTAAAP